MRIIHAVCLALVVLAGAVAAQAQTVQQNVNLTWDATPGATSYVVEKKVGATGSYATIASPATNSYKDTNVAAGVVLFYRVSSRNALMTGVPSDEFTTSTLGAQGKTLNLRGSLEFVTGP